MGASAQASVELLAGRPPRRAGLTRERLAWIGALVVCSGWTLALAGGFAGWSSTLTASVYWLLLAGPAIAVPTVLFWHPHSPPQAKLILAWTLLVASAKGAFSLVGTHWEYGLAPAALGLSAVITRRWPMPTLAVAFGLAGAGNPLDAFVGVSARPIADLALAGCWGAVLIGWLGGRRRGSILVPVSLALLALYLLASLVSVLGVSDLTQGAQSFRISCWTMAAVPVVALVLEGRRQRVLAHRTFLVLAAAAAAYAMLRWAIGPSHREEEIVRRAGVYVLLDGELKLFGAQGSPFVLGVWASVVVPFCLASALAPIGTLWRGVALAGAIMAGLAIGPTGSRASIAAAGAGMVTVLTLLAFGRGFRGRRALPLALGAIVVLASGGAFVASKLADKGVSGQRFRGLLNPSRDLPFQERIVKWKTILADIDEYPAGHGLGSSGEAEQRYARFASPATLVTDSVYVKVAYDQGVVGLILFIAVLVALLAHLARQALTRTDPFEATVALGACAALVAFATAMVANDHTEQLAALAVWAIVGLGMAASVHAPDRGLRATRAAGSRHEPEA